MRMAVERIEVLHYKLRMFGIPIEGPMNVFCNNEAMFKNTSIPKSTLKKKHNSICYHRCREAVAARVMRVAKEGTLTNLADLFTKPLMQSIREGLLDRFTYLTDLPRGPAQGDRTDLAVNLISLLSHQGLNRG